MTTLEETHEEAHLPTYTRVIKDDKGGHINPTFNIVLQEHKLVLSFSPKCGYMSIVFFINRLYGMDVNSRYFEKFVVRHLDIFLDNPEYTCVFIMRDPVYRCLSGYLNQIIMFNKWATGSGESVTF